MSFTSINPYTSEVLKSYNAHSVEECKLLVAELQSSFKTWRTFTIEKRTLFVVQLAVLLRQEKEELAKMITLEMGKPILESIAEIEKCALLCDYYAENSPSFLADEIIKTEATKSYVTYEPLGVILGIMPWNFPFWQVFRFAIPAIISGNVCALKHSPNVQGCAQLIEDLFDKAGFQPKVFINLRAEVPTIAALIGMEEIKAISLTGSEAAGRSVAEIAGKHLKKCVLELGGSNAFVVWNDAHIEQSVELAVKSRFLNAGQSCIAAKRFFIMNEVYDEFMALFVAKTKHLKIGSPSDSIVDIGVLARKDLAEKLNAQLHESEKLGATLLVGGNSEKCFFEPTILENVTPEMPVFIEETFGPLACITRVFSEEESIQLATKTNYGLGITICTSTPERAISYSIQIPDGAIFINEMVKSDPRLPFGGTKNSGIGRELGRDGILEFVNRKTIYIR